MQTIVCSIRLLSAELLDGTGGRFQRAAVVARVLPVEDDFIHLSVNDDPSLIFSNIGDAAEGSRRVIFFRFPAEKRAESEKNGKVFDLRLDKTVFWVMLAVEDGAGSSRQVGHHQKH